MAKNEVSDEQAPSLGQIIKEISEMKAKNEDAPIKCFDIGADLDFAAIMKKVKEVMPEMPEDKEWDVIIWMSTDGKAIAVILDPYKTFRWKGKKVKE